jgi:hypothetical protein
MMRAPFVLLASLSIPGLFLLPGVAQPPSGRQPPAFLFETADRCMACHNGLTTPSGEDVSIGFDWRASMMANSARDPYWQAAVRREILDHPESQAEIEDECSTCHMPMARFVAKTGGERGRIFAHLPIGQGVRPADLLAADGVSCTVCHQIRGDNFGEEESFVGGFVIDTTVAWGAREVFGPFAVDSGRVTIMHSASGFLPTEGTHVQQSELCATCHTLYTHTRGPGGTVIRRFPEQVPYLEWRHSGFRTERSCQSCHMPVVEDSVAIASVLGPLRAGFSRHEFRGGNFFVLRMLNRYRNELGVMALPQELEATALRTEDNLRERTAVVSIVRAEFSAGRLETEIKVENLGGHKLPTAYPSRRVWLHVTVRDSRGGAVFRSGSLRRDGGIEGNDNDAEPSRYEPHYDIIDRPDQVQIYESIMVDSQGAVTTGLLSAVQYTKDNRILPRGFDKATAHPDIAVYGRANEDPDFRGGTDQVRYSIDPGKAEGPFQVEAELWFQPISYRWAQNLRPYDAPETRRFVSYYESMASSSAFILARSHVVSR